MRANEFIYSVCQRACMVAVSSCHGACVVVQIDGTDWRCQRPALARQLVAAAGSGGRRQRLAAAASCSRRRWREFVITEEGPTCNSSQITGGYSKDSSTNGTKRTSTSLDAADTSTNRNSSSEPLKINISGIGFRSSILWDSGRSLVRRNSSAGATQVCHLSPTIVIVLQQL